MKIAIIGSGISGLYAAHYLSKHHQVTVYEANSTPGGPTDTHSIVLGDRTYAVDTGFIVFNEHKQLNPGKAIDDKKQISFADIDARIMGKKGCFDYGLVLHERVLTSKQCKFGQF